MHSARETHHVARSRRVADSDNLLTVNPSFENDYFGFAPHGIKNILGWELDYFSYNGITIRGRGGAEDQPTDGEFLFYMETGARATTAADSRANVTPGRTYKMAIDPRAYDAYPVSFRGITPYIQFFDAGGNRIKQVTGMDGLNPVPGSANYNESGYDFGWQTVTMTAVAPPGAVKAGVQVIVETGGYPNSSDRWTRIDNARLTLVPETVNLVSLRNAPRSLARGTSANVVLRYIAAQSNVVNVRLLRGNVIVAQAQKSVGVGRGTESFFLPVPANAAPGSTYAWETRLQVAGTNTLVQREVTKGAFIDDTQSGSGTVDADHPYLLYGGRWDNRTAKAPAAYWAQSQVQTRFAGTSLTARINKPGFENADLVVVFDNDESTMRHVTVPAFSYNEISLTASQPGGALPLGNHSVTMMLNTESNIGSISFQGLRLDAGKGLLKPEPRPARRVEIYGDSISSGGVPDPLVANPNLDNDGDYQSNVYRAFGAEYRSVSKGGSGVAGGFVPYNALQYYDKCTFDAYNPDAAETWDFSKWTPDAVIVAYGHSDQFGNNANYVPNYKTLVQNLRAKYPNAEIFCANTSMTDSPSHFKRAILPLLGDPKVHFKPVRPGQGHGGHPRLNDHREMATGNANWEGLADWIGDTMGW